MKQPFPNRDISIAVWNVEPRLVDQTLMSLEKHLKKLGQVEIKKVDSIHDPDLSPCDLLVVIAQSFEEKPFVRWIEKLRLNMKQQGNIWIPALVLTKVSFDALNEIFLSATKQNWYFDIMHPDHMESLPIRVANMLRIHDHLHELKRYSEFLDVLQDRVSVLESELEKIDRS